MQAQVGGTARPVVQTVPGAGSIALNNALGRLGRNPRDIEALLDAGKAAVSIGDIDAAIGFYQRADQLMPSSPRAKAGLASAYLRGEDPFLAIPQFDAAEKLGANDPAFASDRGLAFDLVGDNLTAQQFYRQALAVAPDDETSRRQALSFAIAGDRAGMEAALAPLLQRQDKAAWRTRAFALAILGKPGEAEAIVSTMMPADLAGGITPYLRYLPRLTKAQQAAASSFGHFPRASEIGRDDPRLAQYVRARPVRVAAADAGLVPTGRPLGRNTRGRNNRDTKPAPVAIVTRPARSGPAALPATTPARIEPAPRLVTAPVTQVLPPPVAKTPVVAAPVVVAVSTPAPPLAALAPTITAPVVTVAAAPPPPRPRSLAEAFGDFTAPSREAEPVAGAVDIRRITPTKTVTAAATPAKPVKPAPPSHPSRIWVQVATGRDKGALAFDWRRFTRQAAEVFRTRKGYVSSWGQTNRLLTGPFESEAAANSFITQLRRADVGGAFVWNSPAGQVVDVLAAK